MTTLRTALLTLFWGLPCVSVAGEATSWVCVSEMATGFMFKAGRWQETSFTRSHKYIVSRSKPNSPHPWEVKEVGTKTAVVWYHTASESVAWLTCSGLQEFRLNTKTLKFVSAYLQGYWTPLEGDGPDAPRNDTPFIEIGRCSPM